jgi:hypothetical protein
MRLVPIALIVAAFGSSHPAASGSIAETRKARERPALPAGATASRARAPVQPQTRLSSTAAVRYIPFADAVPILASLPKTLLPADLAEEQREADETSWAQWVSRRDADIRARLLRGDEDSIVNLLLFGTTFTTERRATAVDLATLAGPDSLPGGIARRIDDIVEAVMAPGADERMMFARTVLERRNVRPGSPGGRAQFRAALADLTRRMAREWSSIDWWICDPAPTA